MTGGQVKVTEVWRDCPGLEESTLSLSLETAGYWTNRCRWISVHTNTVR